MKYFLLNPECYFVRGAVRGAIYNLHTGNVFSVGPELTVLLSACETDRKPLEEAFRTVETPPEETMKTLRKLWVEKLGRFYETQKCPPVIEKLKPPKTLTQKAFEGLDLALLLLELTGECNLNCVFCEADTLNVRRMRGCARWPIQNGKRPLELKDWEKVISDGEKRGCRALTFFGGEPLLQWEMLSHLVEFAAAQGYNQIKVETNGWLLDEPKIGFFKEQNVLVALQILSFKETAHDQITRVAGSFRKMMESLDRMAKNQVRYAFTLPVTEGNGDHLQETMEWFQGYEPEQFIADPIYPRAKGDLAGVSRVRLRSLYRAPPKAFGPVKAERFFRYAEYHPCFAGQLAVTACGDVLPCPLARKEVIGNIRDKDLLALFRDRDMSRHWLTTKDNVTVCRDCEYRYACFDCRPLERSLCQQAKGRSELCTYDPYRGEWTNVTVRTSDTMTGAASPP